MYGSGCASDDSAFSNLSGLGGFRLCCMRLGIKPRGVDGLPVT
jgi:hypothetical protein